MAEKLRIGKISYLNLMPIFRSLNLEADDHFEVIEGVPSELNRMLRDGQLDLEAARQHPRLNSELDGLLASPGA